MILCSFFAVNSSAEVSTTKWVKSYGTEYQMGMLVCVKKDIDFPVFNRIVNIIIKDSQAFLLICQVDTLHFDEHLNAYCINDTVHCSYSVLSVGDLRY